MAQQACRRGHRPPDTADLPLAELSNVEFHCGRAEELVPALVSRLASQQLVAILDPPRAGLREWPPPQGLLGGRRLPRGWLGPSLRGAPWGPPVRLCVSPDSKAVLAVRRAENVRRLLYVSCNPRAAMGNFVE